MRGLFTLNNLSTAKIQDIINRAIEFKHGLKKNYSGLKIANLFFESSTRTQYSFHIAMLNLNITPISFSSVGSSVEKSETFYDTVKTFECLGVDGMVIRHGDDKFYNQLNTINVPIWNGGDGKSDHPTQTLLDLMTIYEEFGHFNGLKLCFIGDVSHSRVAHGNAVTMRRLGMDISVCTPPEFFDNTAPLLSIDEAVTTCDVINLLRIQFERHNVDLSITAKSYHDKFGMTMTRINQMKETAIIMHPAPINRGIEIDNDVAECAKSRICKQMTNGVYIRMAVLDMCLEGEL